jgi:hypothetical protein
MPLARILTRNPERTADLSRQLQQQGYTVEVANPEQTGLAAADLEIEFEICERADVLERAADLSNELDADVAVAPGALLPSEASASRSVVEMKASPARERDPEREFEAAFNPVIEMPVASAVTPPAIDVPVMEQTPLPPVAFLDEMPRMEPVAMAENKPVSAPVSFSEPPRPADPIPYLAQLTPFSSPAARSEETAPPAKQPQPAQAATGRGRQLLQGGARFAARTWAGVLAMTSTTSEYVRDYFQEYSKRAQVRSAESRAAHAARLLDLEQRRAEAQERAAELEAAREEAAARLVELVRQRGPGLHEQDERPFESAYLESTPAKMRDPEFEPAALSSEPQRAAGRTPIALWRRLNPALRPVLTGAAAATALFIMGIALGLFHSRTPLANPANPNGTSAQSGGVTVQTGGVTVQAGQPKAQPAKPSAGVQAPSGTTSPAQAKGAAPAKPSPRVSPAQHLVTQQAESMIGDDVVIRRFSRPVPTQRPKQSGQQAGLKHFSDMEN